VDKHVETIALVSVAILAISYALKMLVEILVPFVVSLLFAQLCAPALNFAVLTPYKRAMAGRSSEEDENLLVTPGGSRLRRLLGPISTRANDFYTQYLRGCAGRCGWVGIVLWRVYALLIIVLCLSFFLGVAATVILGIESAFDPSHMDWQKYAHSQRLQNIAQLLQKLGFSTSGDKLFDYLRGPIEQVGNGLLALFQGYFLTLLFLSFLLLGHTASVMSPSDENVRHPTFGASSEITLDSDVKGSISTYFGIKTMLSFILGIWISIVLGVMVKVDLWFVFVIIAFLLNYVPTIGGIISTLAPLPLVYLDEQQPLVNVLWAFLLPALSHVAIGQLLETTLLAGSLELHPITVMFSLTYWGMIWGIPGAMLSVPLTCSLRISLERLGPVHPYVTNAFFLLQGRRALTATEAELTREHTLVGGGQTSRLQGS